MGDHQHQTVKGRTDLLLPISTETKNHPYTKIKTSGHAEKNRGQGEERIQYTPPTHSEPVPHQTKAR